MIKRSITLKLFFMLLILLVTFAIAAVGFQAHYFTTYYQQHLDDAQKVSMKNFARDYTYTDSREAKQNLLDSFIQGNTSMAAIVNESGQIKYSYDFKMTVKTPDGRLIDIPVENLGTLRELQSLEIYTNDELYVEGLYDKKQGAMIQINCISKNGKKSFVDQKNDFTLDKLYPNGPYPNLSQDVNIVPMAFKAVVIAATFPTPNMIDLSSRKNVLSEALQRLNSDAYYLALQKNDFYETTYQSLLTHGAFRTFILPLSSDGEPEFLVAMTPRKPVDEILSMMVPFYKAVTLSSLLAAILVSIVFSIFIAKPLVRLNQAAIKLSQLDFDSAPEIRSEDELGSLSRSLTSLALNLKQHMMALTVSNQQLQNELDKERTLDKIRRDFVSSVSHELKTPLAIIRGYSEAIQDHLNPDKADHYIAVILDEIQRMDHLVLDMLDLFRLDSKSQRSQQEPFNLSQMVEDLIMKFEMEIKRKNLFCDTQFEDFRAMALGDRMRIDQVFKNLMSNAIRHAPEGSRLQLKIFKRPASDDQPMCYQIELFNEGPPIPDHHLPLVWERFYRVEKDRGRQSGGTGLGLSIVKSILEGHNSHFGLRNEDSGVTAYFTLKKASRP